jgi:hypothetical protein
MWRISAVPLYLWCMLLPPSAIVAICIAMQRKWAYLPIIPEEMILARAAVG